MWLKAICPSWQAEGIAPYLCFDATSTCKWTAHEQGTGNLGIKRHQWLSQSQETKEMAQHIQWSNTQQIDVHEMPLCVSLGHRTRDESLPEPVMTRFTDMCWDRWLPSWKRQWLHRPTLKYALSTRCNTCMQVGKQHVTNFSMLYQEIDKTIFQWQNFAGCIAIPTF